MGRAEVVEAHAIDERAFAPQPEQAWAGVPRLRPGSDGADLDVPESERAERVDVFAVLVEARGEPDTIAKSQAADFNLTRGVLGQWRPGVSYEVKSAQPPR